MNMKYIGLSVYLLLYKSAVSSNLSQRGAYKSDLVSVAKCSVTTLPSAPNSPFLLVLEQDKKTGLVNGNITIQTNNITNLKVKVQLFLWENNEWHLSLNVPGYSCNRPFLRGLLAATGMKGDRTKCSLSKGFYSIRNVDVDIVNHLWLVEIDYGTVMSRSEVMDKKHTHMCVEAVMKITPKLTKRS